MDIEYIKTADLTPYAKNAKKHHNDQVRQIANSINEFGFRQPLVIDANNVVIIGHGRLMAAKMLGIDAVPCVRADDLSDTQVKALRLADNKTNESEWDFDDLSMELEELEVDGFDMRDFGFEDATPAQAEPIALQDDAKGERDNVKTMHCPKCGFVFEVQP